MQTMNIIGTAVGINQNNPQASLDVAGKIKGSGAVTNFTGQHRCVPEGPMEPGLIVSADKNRYVNMNGRPQDGLQGDHHRRVPPSGGTLQRIPRQELLWGGLLRRGGGYLPLGD